MSLLHARTRQHQYRVRQACQIIAQARAACPSWYVALSGGKDSTVVLDLVGDVTAVFSDDEWWLPETEDYIKRISQVRDMRWIRTNAHHTDWFEPRGDWDGIPYYAREQGWRGVYLGLREDESSARRVHLRTRGPLYYAKGAASWHCNPIAKWSALDVWAYIHDNNLDYNRAYDVLAGMDIPLERQRIGPFAVERALGYGQLAILKRGWPELYNRFVEKYPQASAYV